MFSSLWSGIKSVGTSIGNTIGNYFSGGNSNTAAVGNVTRNTSSNIGSNIASIYNNAGVPSSNRTINAVSVPSSVGPVGSASYNAFVASNPIGTSITSSSGNGTWTNLVNTPQLPVTISSGQQKTSGGSVLGASTQYIAPATTISSKNLSSASMGLSESGTGGTPAPVVLGSAPNSYNPGVQDTTKLAGTMAGYYTRNADGTYTEAKNIDQPKETDTQTVNRIAQLRKDILGEPKIAAEDPEVIAARQQRQRIQQSLLAPTNELNAVIAKQNADLLAHRKMVSEEGGTSTGFGGIESAINYNAAIRSLPLQASIAAIQGDLKLAQDYLTELTQIKTEQINAQAKYNEGLFNAIMPALEKKDQRAYEELKAENTRQTNAALDLEKFKVETVQTALNNGASISSPIIARIHNATDKMGALQAAGQYAAQPNTQITQLDNGETVVVDKTTGKIVSNLGGAKSTTSGVSVAGLTPEQANDPFIKKLAASAGGKPITDTFAQQLNKGLTVLGQIGSLEANIKDVKTGPIVGAFKGANPWDTNAQTIKAQLNAIIPNLARGVYGEVGVLTDNDIAQYSKTLPNLKSTEDIRNAVLGITVDIIGKSIKRNLEINAANGKDVSGFIDIYTEMQNTRDSIFTQIPGYKGAQTTTTATPEQQSLRSKYGY